MFYNPTENLDITFGVNLQAITHVLDQASLPVFGVPFIPSSLDDENIETTALLTQATYKSSEHLTFVAGVRLEKQNKFSILGENYDQTTQVITKTVREFDQEDLEVIPRFAAIYEISNDSIMKFLFGQAINRPSFSQLQFSQASRPLLKPEFMTTYEINYATAYSNNLTFNVSVFHNILEDLITRTDVLLPNGTFTNFSSNSGKQVTDGLEFTAQAKPMDALRFDFSATYQNTKDKRDGFGDLDVAYSPSLLAQFKLAYHLHDMTIAFSGNYVDKMETLFQGPPPSVSLTGKRDGPQTDAHFVFNANFRKDNILKNMFGEGLYANIRISNLLDEEYTYPVSSFNSWADKGLPGDERMFMLSFGSES